MERNIYTKGLHLISAYRDVRLDCHPAKVYRYILTVLRIKIGERPTHDEVRRKIFLKLGKSASAKREGRIIDDSAKYSTKSTN